MDIKKLLFHPEAFFSEKDVHPAPLFLLYLAASVVLIGTELGLAFLRGAHVSWMEPALQLAATAALPLLINAVIHVALIIMPTEKNLLSSAALAETLAVVYAGHSVLLLYTIPLLLIATALSFSSIVTAAAALAIGALSFFHVAYIEVVGITHLHGIGKHSAFVLILLGIGASAVLILHYMLHVII